MKLTKWLHQPWPACCPLPPNRPLSVPPYFATMFIWNNYHPSEQICFHHVSLDAFSTPVSLGDGRGCSLQNVRGAQVPECSFPCSNKYRNWMEKWRERGSDVSPLLKCLPIPNQPLVYKCLASTGFMIILTFFLKKGSLRRDLAPRWLMYMQKT